MKIDIFTHVALPRYKQALYTATQTLGRGRRGPPHPLDPLRVSGNWRHRNSS